MMTNSKWLFNSFPFGRSFKVALGINEGWQEFMIVVPRCNNSKCYYSYRLALKMVSWYVISKIWHFPQTISVSSSQKSGSGHMNKVKEKNEPCQLLTSEFSKMGIWSLISITLICTRQRVLKSENQSHNTEIFTENHTLQSEISKKKAHEMTAIAMTSQSTCNSRGKSFPCSLPAQHQQVTKVEAGTEHRLECFPGHPIALHMPAS